MQLERGVFVLQNEEERAITRRTLRFDKVCVYHALVANHALIGQSVARGVKTAH